MHREQVLPQLAVGRYRLDFQASGPINLPSFAGSAWRGALGHALKQAVCVTHERHCEDCLLFRSCAYPYVFHTPPPLEAAKMRRYTAAPHPFVLRPGAAPPGSRACSLFLTLFGGANQQLPVVVYALMRAASGARGVAHNRLELEAVHQATSCDADEWVRVYEPGGKIDARPAALCTAPPPPEGVTITLLTPLRVKREGRHVGCDQFAFHDLFGNLLRRISMLTYFHTDTPLETDFRGLMERARSVRVDTNLHWVDLTRYSTRQKATLKVGGVQGTIRIRGQNLEPFWPYLWLGQFTHAGTAATMGLGHYALASLPDSTPSPPAR